MAKSSRFQYKYRKSASKLHKAVGDTIRTHQLLKHYTSYQEYSVSRINSDYHTNSHKFDWVIIELKVVIEVHGQQHYMPVCFGGISKEEATKRYHDQVERDLEKKAAAEEAGWTYIAVRYDDTLDVDRLVDLAIKNSAPITPRKKKSLGMSDDQKEFKRKIKEEQKAREKEYRKKLKKQRHKSSN